MAVLNNTARFMGTIFIAGAYGVGKSTIAKALSTRLSIPSYSASKIISQVNGEDYTNTKIVKDKYRNQDILTVSVGQLLNEFSKIILTGHFCIVNKSNEIERLPQDVYQKLSIEHILLLEATPTNIVQNLNNRDGVLYDIPFIESLLQEERCFAEEVSNILSCPLIIHQMNYQCDNVQKILHLLNLG